MVNRIFTSLTVILLGLLTALLPRTFLPVCTATIQTVSGSEIPMKCFWTAQASLGLGGLLCAAGIFLYLSKSVLIRLGISTMIFLNALLLAAIPAFLIGVCPGETMPCHLGTYPALLVLAVLIGITSLGNIGYLYKISRN